MGPLCLWKTGRDYKPRPAGAFFIAELYKALRSVKMPDRDRAELEITPQMIEAGFLVLCGYESELGDPKETAVEVYKAMEEKKITKESGTEQYVFPVPSISAICRHHQAKSQLREIRLLGQNILDSREFREGDRLYLYATPESKPLVAELKLADSYIPFIPADKNL